MLLPKRVKYRRVQRDRMTGKAMRGNKGNQSRLGSPPTRSRQPVLP